MDDILIKYLTDNALTLIFVLYILSGFADTMMGVEGVGKVRSILREIGFALNKVCLIIEGAIEAIKPKRVNGGPK
uniref:Uncharacterized protein n=1 Tax=viral metagenome TaxID=1070528 RepID=A0A6M3L114_9ZZZZ